MQPFWHHFTFAASPLHGREYSKKVLTSVSRPWQGGELGSV